MMEQSRRCILIKAVHDAAIELAKRAARGRYAPKPGAKPKPAMVAISAPAIFGSSGSQSPT